MTKLGLPFDGEELKLLRKKAEITQEELAELIGLSRETVNAIENNRPSAIKAITWNTISLWQETCIDRVDRYTRSKFKRYLSQILKL